MNNEEKKTVVQLYESVNKIKQENKILAEKLTEMVNKIDNKVNEKHIPIFLEKDIMGVMQHSIQKAIQECLTGYSSPLNKLVTAVVNENSTELKQIISDSFDDVIKKDEFKQAIKDGFSHKIARTLIIKNDSLFDKISNELKQDAIFKSKVSLAIANVVNECLDERRI
jgi:hypothetical protein